MTISFEDGVHATAVKNSPFVVLVKSITTPGTPSSLILSNLLGPASL